LTLEDGINRLSRNVDKELPLYAVQADLMNPWHYLQLMNLFFSGSLGREVTCCSEARGWISVPHFLQTVGWCWGVTSQGTSSGQSYWRAKSIH